MNFTILRFDTIDSTNTEALDQACLGADEGVCIIARQQTAGRGRNGRAWISPKDAGLYLSIVLRPKLEPRYLPLITMMTAVAVHDTLADLGLRPDIKWPNDILVGEKKICGILAETTETKLGLAVVVGIGVNFAVADHPSEIAGSATSIKTEIGKTLSIDYLTDLLLRHFALAYKTLGTKAGPADTLDEWRKRSTYYCGKNVRVKTETETIPGVTDGLEPNGSLRVTKPDGTTAIVQTGDVEQVRMAADLPSQSKSV